MPDDLTPLQRLQRPDLGGVPINDAESAVNTESLTQAELDMVWAADRIGELERALRRLYYACELRANKEGGDFGPIIGPAAEIADAALSGTPAPAEHPVPGDSPSILWVNPTPAPYPLIEGALKRAQKRAHEAHGLLDGYDRALIEAYLGDAEVEDFMLAEYANGVSPTARGEIVRLLQAIGAKAAP